MAANEKRLQADETVAQGAITLDRLAGHNISIDRAVSPVENRVKSLTGGLLDSQDIAHAQTDLLKQKAEADNKFAANPFDEKLAENVRKLDEQLAKNNEALGIVATSTTRLAAIQDKIQQLEQNREKGKALGERLLTAGPAELVGILRDQSALAAFKSGKKILGGQNNKDVIAGFDQINPLTGSPEEQKKRRDEFILKLSRGRFNGTIIGEDFKPIKQTKQGKDLFGQANAAINNQANAQDRQADLIANQAEAGKKTFAAALVETNKLVKDNLNGTLRELTLSLGKLNEVINGIARPEFDRNGKQFPTDLPPGFASGGLVRGKKGRDKIHARLTDGEFVVPKNIVENPKNRKILEGLLGHAPTHAEFIQHRIDRLDEAQFASAGADDGSAFNKKGLINSRKIQILKARFQKQLRDAQGYGPETPQFAPSPTIKGLPAGFTSPQVDQDTLDFRNNFPTPNNIQPSFSDGLSPEDRQRYSRLEEGKIRAQEQSEKEKQRYAKLKETKDRVFQQRAKERDARLGVNTAINDGVPSNRGLNGLGTRIVPNGASFTGGIPLGRADLNIDEATREKYAEYLRRSEQTHREFLRNHPDLKTGNEKPFQKSFEEWQRGQPFNRGVTKPTFGGQPTDDQASISNMINQFKEILAKHGEALTNFPQQVAHNHTIDGAINHFGADGSHINQAITDKDFRDMLSKIPAEFA